jgi:hypothetical protein
MLMAIENTLRVLSPEILMNTRQTILCGILAVMLAFIIIACKQPDDSKPADITYTIDYTDDSVRQIVFFFSTSVDSLNLTIADIIVGGDAEKGSATLTGSGASRTLAPITVNSTGGPATITIAIAKDGIETETKNITPFIPGIPGIIDRAPPTVRLSSPDAGSPIWGTQTFTGFAEDDNKLEKVEFIVTNYPDEINPYREYTEVTLSRNGPDKANWEMSIDTTLFTNAFGDGYFKIRLKATDSAGKTAETDEIVFFVRNEPPDIKVTSPYIAQGDNDGEIGSGGHLNYGVINSLPSSIDYSRQMDAGSYITGTISYEEGIYTGAPVGERYPPQIRIWPISDTPGNGEYRPGEWPSAEQVPWQNFVSEDNLFPLGMGRYTFMWPVPEAGRFYGFEIRAQSLNTRDDDIVKFHYPRDYWPDIEKNGGDWDNPPADNDFITENRYVLFYLRQMSPSYP